MARNNGVEDKPQDTQVASESVAASQIIALNNSTKFDVNIETASGNPLIVFQGIPAKTRAQAINKAQQMLVFTAERTK